MDSRALNTLRRVEQNDDTLFKLQIGDVSADNFNSSDGDDYSRLGAAIGDNTHLTTLTVDLNENTLSVEDRVFYDGLKHNSSIFNLFLRGDIMLNNNTIIGGVIHEVLKVYQENSGHLTAIGIKFCNLGNGGDAAVSATLRRCTNLKHINLSYCGITDEQLLQIVEGVRGHCSLEVLNLSANRIGHTRCQALSTLLEDPNCHICTLRLQDNQIEVEGIGFRKRER